LNLSGCNQSSSKCLFRSWDRTCLLSSPILFFFSQLENFIWKKTRPNVRFMSSSIRSAGATLYIHTYTSAGPQHQQISLAVLFPSFFCHPHLLLKTSLAVRSVNSSSVSAFQLCRIYNNKATAFMQVFRERGKGGGATSTQMALY
jgi:hypothetical protein